MTTNEKVMGLHQPEVMRVVDAGIALFCVFGAVCCVISLTGSHRLPVVDFAMGFMLVANVAFGVNNLKSALGPKASRMLIEFAVMVALTAAIGGSITGGLVSTVVLYVVGTVFAIREGFKLRKERLEGIRELRAQGYHKCRPMRKN